MTEKRVNILIERMDQLVSMIKFRAVSVDVISSGAHVDTVLAVEKIMAELREVILLLKYYVIKLNKAFGGTSAKVLAFPVEVKKEEIVPEAERAFSRIWDLLGGLMDEIEKRPEEMAVKQFLSEGYFQAGMDILMYARESLLMMDLLTERESHPLKSQEDPKEKESK